MRAAIRGAVGLALALVVGCNFSWGDSGEECCAWETRTTGGTVTSIDARGVLRYDDVTIEHERGDFEVQGGRITINADLPASWTAPGDAGAGDAAADAGAIGAARGWGRRGRVAVIDLGTTPEEGELTNARLVFCADPYEELVLEVGSAYVCESGVRRPARVEALTGTYARLASSTSLQASTESGAIIRYSSSSYTSSSSSYQACTHASFTC